MNILLLCISLLCTFFAATAQKQELAQFQRTHPNVSFLSRETFQSLSSSEIDLLQNRYILFDQQMEDSDLSSYHTDKTVRSSKGPIFLGTEMSVQQHDAVKSWLLLHPHVKIVTRSQFEAVSVFDQTEYVNHQCLILLGEEVTIEDINLYPY
jgi:hypothetical protein